MIKGIVHLEWTDVNTGEVVREHTQENFIFFGSYADLWIGGTALERPAIIGRGTDVFPYYDKSRTFYGQNQPGMTGYIPEGQTRKKFFEKTDNSDAYWDFYSLFLPPAVVSSIPCISLVSNNSDNITFDQMGTSTWTALNLDPYCWQSPTEYLNVYYRLIMLEDKDNTSPDFIRSQFVLDLDRYSNKVIFPNVDHKTYPFRIEQDLSRDGYVNFLSSYSVSLGNKSTVRPQAEHNKLYNCQKTYTYPDANPNQYTQANYALVNTVIRGFGNGTRMNGFNSTSSSNGTLIGVNPVKITEDIGLNFTGIGNVFSASRGSRLTVFDASFFPAGSGRMQTAGVLADLKKDPFPTTFQCEITKESQTWNGAEYKLYEYRGLNPQGISPITLNLFPSLSWDGSTWNYDQHYLTDAKKLMYKEPDRVHISTNVVKYVENRAFITWDKTGITIYDIYHGKLDSFDLYSQASLAVTKINDVKVDALGAIWISCGDTGLWKLELKDDDTIVLTRIGILPGSQQKCYAIDVDNFGNVFAIFWGQGLFYTADGGTSWVNVPIDYAPFSGFEAGGFISKWSYCARMIVNPFRDARNGVSQYLLLLGTSSPDYSSSGGCWYDAQSQLTTGITNTTLKNNMAVLRNGRACENIKISDDTDTWFFMVNAGSMHSMPYQHNAATTAAVTFNTANVSASVINQEWSFDPDLGVLREYMLLGLPAGNTWTTATGEYAIYDVLSKTAKRFPFKATGSTTSLRNPDTSCFVKIGFNMFVGFCTVGNWYNGNVSSSFVVTNQFYFSKELRQWSQKNWGWNGSKWVLNHMGGKPIHSNNQELFRGVSNRFTDGPAASFSWSLGDTFTFTVFDGFFKDNSTTMALRDTIYYKPTDTNYAFEPNIVTRIDKSSDVGVLNQSPIELEWNIDDLPDTMYSGGSISTDGDPYFQNTTYLAYFNKMSGFNPIKGVHDLIIGQPLIDDSSTIFGDSMVRVDGNSGFFMESSNSMALGNTFTIEGMFKPSETGSTMYLFDMRSTVGNALSMYINTDGKLVVLLGGTTYGNVGEFIFPGETYYIALTRNNNDWIVYLNGVEQFTFQNGINLSASAPLNVLKRYQTTQSGWEGFKGWASNIRITRDVLRPIEIPTAYYPSHGNDYSGAQLVLSGNFNMGSLISKRELVGDWEVIFRDITDDMLATRRSRPKIAFGVSTQKLVESPTDISYRVTGQRIGKFMENYNEMTAFPTGTKAVKITKKGFMVKIWRSNDGINWIIVRENMQDYNPLHHIAIWQVQKDVQSMLTPSVEIVNNGSAVFSKVGTATSARGYFHPKFLALDVSTDTDINIQLNGVQVTKGRSNFSDIGYPLEGEVLAMQAGTLTFHENDIGKLINGKMITLHD